MTISCSSPGTCPRTTSARPRKQVVLLRVQVYPGSYYKDKNGPIHYAPNAFVLEMHEFRKPGEPFAEPGTYTRRGHWRTSKNGVRHWVGAAERVSARTPPVPGTPGGTGARVGTPFSGPFPELFFS